MAVGPSAPPIMAIAAASFKEKSNPGIVLSAKAPRRVAKIPNCAAAPSRVFLG